jgi:hypothetical protein
VSVLEADRPTIYRGLAEAARRIPSFRNGKSTHPATLTRWITRGVRLNDGRTLKLAARRFPGGWAVADDALDEFINKLTADRTGEPVAQPARRQAVERAEAELDRIGI